MEKKGISLIIPFYNEEGNIDDLLNYLDEQYDEKKFELEVVFVDDGSTDKSLDKLIASEKTNYDKKIVKLSKNFGSHAAIRAGIKNSKHDICAFLSADLQEPFEVIYRMYDKLKEGYEVVFAFKEQVFVSRKEKFFSNAYSRMIKKYALKDFPIQGMNNVMFDSKVKEILNDHIEKNSSIFLQILDLGFNKTFIPYNLIKRKKGKSKWTFSKKLKLYIDSFVSFSYFPIRMVSIIGVIMFLLAIITVIVIFIIKVFFDNNMPLGYPTSICILLFGFGINNISIGVIAEYLWRTLDVARNRQIFVIDEIYEKERLK